MKLACVITPANGVTIAAARKQSAPYSTASPLEYLNEGCWGPPRHLRRLVV